MLLSQPAVDAAHISKWIGHACERRRVALVAERSAAECLPVMEQITALANPHFDFSKARGPLLRARAKSTVRLVKPLRRLATNQEAVNEGLVDAVAALIATNKSMATQIEALTGEVDRLKSRVAQRASHP